MNISENDVNIPPLLTWVVDKKCYHILWHQMDYTHGECLQLLASKIIGYSIVLSASFLLKLPQIIKILKSGRADGVSLWSNILMSISSTTSFTYAISKNFPISVWGENFALAIQNVIICTLVCLYCGRKYTQAAVVTLFNTIFAVVLLLPHLPFTVHIVFSALHLPLISTSKLLQIYSNLRNSSTGELSAISVFMMNFRSFGRLFTFFVETNDSMKMLTFFAASVFNVCLLGQIVYYDKRWLGNRSYLDNKKKY